MEKYFTESPIILDHFPKQGVVFGLLTENYMFRVVRENPEVFFILFCLVFFCSIQVV